MLDWMAGEEGGRRVEWVVGWGGGGGGGGGGGMGTGMGTGKEEEKLACWVYWRRPEEWAEVVAGWVEETGQRGVVLTLWELREGEGTVGRGRLSFLSFFVSSHELFVLSTFFSCHIWEILFFFCCSF